MALSKKIEMTYNKNDLINTLDKIVLSRDNNNVCTYYNGKLLSNSTVSEKYEMFDFSNFSKNIVNNIEDYFQPEKYLIRISKGQQELRLIGEKKIINGDLYTKMFNILNSTDKSRSLQINIGLIRYICSNGVVVASKDEHSSIKTKHFKSIMSDKIKEFEESLKNFNISIDKQCETIESLSGKFVSFRELASKIAVDENGIISNNRMLKLRAFCKKLLESNTDRLANLTNEQIVLLKEPYKFIRSELNTVDIEIPAYKAFNCWTEVFRSYDSSVIKRETNRILELI